MIEKNNLLKENSNFLFDTTSFEKNSLRFILERRLLYRNVQQYLYLKDMELSFNNLNVSTPLYNGLIANFFFLRYFTNKKPFFLPVKVVSTFKTKVYSFRCLIRLTKKDAFSFLLQNISLAASQTASNDFGIYPFSLSPSNFTFFLKNFSFLRVVETHPVFFRWNECLDITLNFKRATRMSEISDYLSLTKINNFILN